MEDEPGVRRFLRAGFQSQGWRVIEALNGAEAASLAMQYVPDVILLDLGLPDMDGLEVLRRVRAWSSLPVLVLSARGQERQKVEALDAGADDYVTKPFGSRSCSRGCGPPSVGRRARSPWSVPGPSWWTSSGAGWCSRTRRST